VADSLLVSCSPGRGTPDEKRSAYEQCSTGQGYDSETHAAGIRNALGTELLHGRGEDHGDNLFATLKAVVGLAMAFHGFGTRFPATVRFPDRTNIRRGHRMRYYFVIGL
jgi:hypothetical protein